MLFRSTAPQTLRTTPTGATADLIDRVRVAADPTNNLVYLGYVIRKFTGKDQLAVLSSADNGSNWSGPRTVATGTGTGAYFIGVPDLAIGPNHEVYAAWSDRAAWVGCDFQFPFVAQSDGSNIFVSKSVDNGFNWTTPAIVSPVFSPYLSGGPRE